MMLRLLLALILCVLFNDLLGQVNSPGATSSFNPGGQYIMLTFDDGPHAVYTPQILDILKEKKVKATFFVVGTKAMHHKEILQRMHSEKHDIGNRGWLSFPITKLATDELSTHVKSTNKVINNVTNTEVKYFRPIHGLTNTHINSQIKDQENMRVILWSLDSKSHEAQNKNSPSKVTENVVSKAKPGDVVLLHDTQEVTVQALPGIIDGTIFYLMNY
jgi:peptidoglycan/xylan/chitin deacetylase (PgdA/CDA1 family)